MGVIVAVPSTIRTDRDRVGTVSRALVRLSGLALLAACTSGGAAEGRPPYTTTFATVGDTTVAHTTGDVPDSLVRHLVVDWRIRTDTGSEVIGDIQGLAVGADGQVWAWDNTAPTLLHIDANGTSIRKVGRVGSGPGEYRSANGMAVARDGALVMWDDENARLTVYGPDGSYRSTVALRFTNCCGLPVTIDTANRIWLTTTPSTIEAAENSVDPTAFIRNAIAYLRFDSTGTPIDTIVPVVLAGESGRVSALDGSSGGIRGAVRQVPYATYPRHAVSPFGHVVQAMARPYTVHAQVNGKPLRITRDFVPPPVADEERAQWRANIEAFMRRENPAFRWNGPDVPSDKPPIDDIAVGLDGRIWVALSVPSESFEPDPPRGPAQNRLPRVAFRPREKRWDVFDGAGRYVGRVVAPRAVTAFVMRDNEVWGVIRDANDVASIVRMHVDPGL